MLPHFHALTIREVRRETADAVSLAFDVPPDLRDDYHFTQGQHLTLRTVIAGEEVRRTYSICSSVDEYRLHGELRVAIKSMRGGTFSRFAIGHLHAGQALDVLTPDGHFHTVLDPAQRKHYVAFTAGSGITPVMSLIKTTLVLEPHSCFTLIYGNRARDTILFFEELQDIKNWYLPRFALHHVLSRAASDVPLASGRIDADKCAVLLRLIPPATIDEAFVSGPSGLIDTVDLALRAAGVPQQHIHIERFAPPGVAAPAAPPPTTLDDSEQVALSVILDGKCHALQLPRSGASVLEVALAAGLDLPYACKSGVCCTCRAKLLEGSVTMDKNYTLEAAEIAQGFILTCQSHPTSDKVAVSFDER